MMFSMCHCWSRTSPGKGGWMKKSDQMKSNAGDDESGKYKVEVIWDSAMYARESELGHLPGLHYLVLWKRYPEEENI